MESVNLAVYIHWSWINVNKKDVHTLMISNNGTKDDKLKGLVLNANCNHSMNF